VPCGNTVGIVGIDSALAKSGTLSTIPNGHPIAPMKFSVSPVVRRALAPINTAHLPEFNKGLIKLSKSDPCLQVIRKQNGECIIAGAGELHIEVALNDLREFLGENIKFTVSPPVVEFCETVTTLSTVTCLGKSPNKFNRLYFTAEPLDEVLLNAIDTGALVIDNLKDLASALVKDFGWNKNDASKVWFFQGTNCIVDCTSGIQYLNEIKEHVIAAAAQQASEGALGCEPMRGIRFNLVDAKLHSDSIHRGAGQIIPPSLRVLLLLS